MAKLLLCELLKLRRKPLFWVMAHCPQVVVIRVRASAVWWMAHNPQLFVCRVRAPPVWWMAHSPQVVVCRVCCACRLLTKRRLCPRFAGAGSGIL